MTYSSSPAIGLGIVAFGARRVTGRDDAGCGLRVGEELPCTPRRSASLLPVSRRRKVAVQIATAAGLEARRAGVAPKTTEDELRQASHRNAMDSRLPSVWVTDRIKMRNRAHEEIGWDQLINDSMNERNL